MRDFVRAVAGVWVEGLEGRALMSVGMVLPGEVVRMETNVGRVTVELTPDLTPRTVGNFLDNYVATKAYDNTVIHRSVPGFVIQGGGYQAVTSYPHITQGPTVANEIADEVAAAGGAGVNVRGTIAMAKLSNNPDSATSEWFINLGDNASNLDTQNGGFTVFGKVIGGGMHTVDAIAGLTAIDASNLNMAFTDLPVVGASAGSNPVVVRSVRAFDELPVRLDGTTKKVMWVDERGAHAAITLSKGTADLKFVGSNLQVVQGAGGVITLTGSAVELVDVATHGTNGTSVLSVTSRGGKSLARVGDITTDGALARIDAKTAWLEGDLDAQRQIGQIDLGQVNRGTLNVQGSGAMVLHVGTATGMSVKTTMSLKEMTVGKWVDDAIVPSGIRAAGITRMVVTGNFSSDVSSTGSIGSVVVTGAINSSSIVADGSIGSVTAASMKGSTVHAGAVSPLSGKNSIGRVTLTGRGTTFSASNIVAPTVGTLGLGTVAASNGGEAFGVSTKYGVARLDAVFGKVRASMLKLKSEVDVLGYFASKKIEAGDFAVTFDLA